MTLPTIHLYRVVEDPALGTFGMVAKEKVPFCCSLELPWRQNKNDISCIPANAYVCERFTHKDLGLAYRVIGVPGRSGVLIHIGNLVKEIRGCILLGNSFDVVTTKAGSGPGVAASRQALFELMAATNNEPKFILSIEDRRKI